MTIDVDAPLGPNKQTNKELHKLSRQTGDQGTELYWTGAKPFLTLNEKALSVHKVFQPLSEFYCVIGQFNKHLFWYGVLLSECYNDPHVIQEEPHQVRDSKENQFWQ